jgi:putative ABC transport system permease protein
MSDSGHGSIFISCLGLFGLVAYTAEQKTKEIGIRKVLGASVPGIVALMSKEFIKWIVVAHFIAWPAAYFLMSQWLRDYAYKGEYRTAYFRVLGWADTCHRSFYSQLPFSRSCFGGSGGLPPV